jgi:MFS family permease
MGIECLLSDYVLKYIYCASFCCVQAIMCLVLHRACFQPLYGQLSNVFGSRYPMIFSVALFILGSGLCGGALSTAVLIAGRAVQGVSEGRINMLIDLIICNQAPLTQRGA